MSRQCNSFEDRVVGVVHVLKSVYLYCWTSKSAGSRIVGTVVHTVETLYNTINFC